MPSQTNESVKLTYFGNCRARRFRYGRLLRQHANELRCRAATSAQKRRARLNKLAEAANSTAVVLYSATLPTISGKPALGLIQTGSGVAAASRPQTGMKSRMPSPQLAPTP